MTSNYESKKLLEEYLLLHYGSDKEVLPYDFGPKEALGFPARAVGLFDFETLSSKQSALDLGCAVGRGAFELSKHFEQVLGIDYSESFIDTASLLRETKQIEYEYTTQGELKNSATALLPEGSKCEGVKFEIGDACNLRVDLGSFDVVLAANLICRLPEPIKLLERFSSLLKPGGQLVITSPYTWLEEHTSKANWLGGFDKEASAVRSLDSLKSILEGSFKLELVTDLPFLIREHERKYQWSVAQGTRWRRS